MSSSNTYAKQYSNRRTTNETEQYKLLLIPKDNSIAVVKSKQCSPAEHDGCFHVQSGGKKFMGVVLAEGKSKQLLIFDLWDMQKNFRQPFLHLISSSTLSVYSKFHILSSKSILS